MMTNCTDADFATRAHPEIRQRIKASWILVEPNLNKLIKKNFFLAIMYMIHVGTYQDRKPEKEDGSVGISRLQRESLLRFDGWVACPCPLNCHREWNFVNDRGLWQSTRESTSVPLFKLSGSGGEQQESVCAVARWLDGPNSASQKDDKTFHDQALEQ
jgi:hypothetical protein